MTGFCYNLSMKRLKREFFERKPEVVAQDLLGKLLVRKFRSKYYIGKIVETEAYLSENDLACHAAKGKTKRNHVMFGPAGHVYIYMIYGMYHCLNFVTEAEHKPSAVLIRAVEPILSNNKYQLPDTKLSELRKLSSGPGKLCRWMEINKALNGEDLSKSNKLFVVNKFEQINVNYSENKCLHLIAGANRRGQFMLKAKKLLPRQIVKTARIGVDYAGDHKHLPLRFYIKDNKFVSKK